MEMRRIEKYVSGKPVYTVVTWDDHAPSCEKCRKVDINKTSTFVLACAEGSPLLTEKCVKVYAPVYKKKREEVLEWAKQAGVFKI